MSRGEMPKLSEEEVFTSLRDEIEDILGRGYCPHCLSDISPVQVYCTLCGKELDEAAMDEMIDGICHKNIRRLLTATEGLTPDQIDYIYPSMMKDAIILSEAVNIYELPHHPNCTATSCYYNCPQVVALRLRRAAGIDEE